MRKILLISILTACIISGLTVFWYIYDYSNNKQTITEEKKSELMQMTLSAADTLDQKLSLVKEHVDRFSRSLDSSLQNLASIEDSIQQLLHKFIALLFWYFLLLTRYTHIAVWSCSILLSIVFVISISTVWVIALQFNSNKINTGATIHNETSRKIVEKNLLYEYEKFKTEEVVIIPTGIYLSSIESKNKSSIIVNGVIWQRYEKTLPDSIQKGIQFSNAEILSIKQQKVHHYTTYNLYRWNVKVALKLKLDYTKYPLDFERVNFKIQQIEGKYKVMPTPDITAYKLTNPTALPGINKEASIPGWDIMESFFTMSTLKNEVDFIQDSYS